MLYPKHNIDLHLQAFHQKVTNPISAYYRSENFFILLKLVGSLNTQMHTLFYNKTMGLSLQVFFLMKTHLMTKRCVICFHAGLA